MHLEIIKLEAVRGRSNIQKKKFGHLTPPVIFLQKFTLLENSIVEIFQKCEKKEPIFGYLTGDKNEFSIKVNFCKKKFTGGVKYQKK